MTDKTETLRILIATNKAAIQALRASMEEKEDALTEAGLANATRVVKDRVALSEVNAEIGELEDYRKANVVEKAEYDAQIGPLRARLETLEAAANAADDQWRRRVARYDTDRVTVNQEVVTLERKVERFEAKLLELLVPVILEAPAEVPPS